MTPEQFFIQNQWILWLLLLWTLPWKGVALWKSGRNGDKVWFIVLFLINTLAILEILYIFVFSKKRG
jgi:methionyl-tRNA synthetase